MIKNLCFIIGINLLVLNQAKAFEVLKKDLYVSPSISIGYTFFAKINYGFSLDFGVRKQNSDKKTFNYGCSFYQYYVITSAPKQGQKSSNSIHRLRSFSLVGQNEVMNFKIGIGRARNKWGYGKHNLCITRGISYDASFAVLEKNNIWLGIRQFRYPPRDWRWFDHPYTSVYSKYQFAKLY